MSTAGPLVFLALLHLVGIGLGAALLIVVLRGDSGAGGEDDGGGRGGGGGPDGPPRRPPGGPPLPDARPARRRLREPGRLADLLPRPPRRVAREPARRRTPAAQPGSEAKPPTSVP